MKDKKNKSESYTLITGGSEGIGKALAHEMAYRNHNILLVALDNPILYLVAEELRSQYSVKVDYLGVNLVEEGAPSRVFDWCNQNGYTINTLINNAGFGRGGLFCETPIHEYYQMIELNNKAVIGLTYYFLPQLQAQKESRILFVSSIEAGLPLPYKAVYTGTKNFLYAFALALREEQKNSPLTVSVLCPGPVLTNKDGYKRIKSQEKRARYFLMMPDEVARISIPAMLKGQRVIIPGKLQRTLRRILCMLPVGWKMSILERAFRVYK